MKTAAIIQARSTSTRFPGKVLTKFTLPSGSQITNLDLLTYRLKRVNNLDDIIIAIPVQDLPLINYCTLHGFQYYEGHPTNVRERVIKCAKENDVDIIVDITADCPFVDPNHVHDLICVMKYSNSIIYASNIEPRTWPDGFDVQVYRTRSLIWGNEKQSYEIAPNVGYHLLCMVKLFHSELSSIVMFNLSSPNVLTFPEMRLTLDTPEDAKVLDHVLHALGPKASAIEIILYMIRHPEIREINKHIKPKDPSEG